MIDYTFNSKEHGEIAGKLYFNFCQSLLTLPKHCEEYSTSSFVFVSKDEKSCMPLLDLKSRKDKMILMNKENVLDGFLVKDPITDFAFEVTCNPTAVGPTFFARPNGVKVSSQEGCGKLNRSSRFIEHNKTEVNVLMFFIGAGLLFFGGYDWDLLLLFTGFGLGFCINFAIYITMANINESFFLHFLILFVSTVMGVLMAYSFYQLEFLAESAIGFISGFLITNYLIFYLDVYIGHVS